MMRWLMMAGVMVVWGGCGGPGPGVDSGQARYPEIEGVGAVAEGPSNGGAGLGMGSLAGALETLQRGGVGTPLLTGFQTEFWPGLLWHSPGQRLTLFGGLGRVGLGAPAFVAYSSPTGIASLRPGGVVTGDQLRERWLMAGFAGAEGWTNWDSPWGVFLQERPEELQLSTNGLSLTFSGPAGFWTMMPLYGAYRPPLQGQEILKSQGLKEKGLLTWEWPVVVARDPLTRLRFWAGATRRFPVGLDARVGVEGRRGVVTWNERFEWVTLPDAWETRPVLVAPVSPTLALGLTKGQSLPVSFESPPLDFEWPTPYGPWFGVPGQGETAASFPVLKYVQATEEVDATAPGQDAAAVEALRQRVRGLGQRLFASVEGYRPEGGGDWDSREALAGYLWQARALPFLDPSIRSNAVACLRLALWDRVLIPGRFVEPPPAAVAQRWSEVGWRSVLLQSLWAVAHATGDRDRVRERWPLLRGIVGKGLAGRTWAGTGSGAACLGDGAAPAIALARLAWLAGDRDGYRQGCALAASELAQVYTRIRGGRWFREQQPWRPGALLTEAVVPYRLNEDGTGWTLAEPGAGWPGERWDRFWDPDVARFCREHLRAEVRAEAGRLPTGGDAAEGLIAWGLGRTHETIQGTRAGEVGMGPSRELERLLGALRVELGERLETLIPNVAVEGGGIPWRTNARLAASIHVERGATPGWPRLRLVDWPTPTGAPWEVGEVRVEEVGVPAGVRVRESWHGVQWEVLGATEDGLAGMFHTPSSRDAARARLARRPKLFRPGLYENILPGEESEANNASRTRSKSQQKGYEISGLGPR